MFTCIVGFKPSSHEWHSYGVVILILGPIPQSFVSIFENDSKSIFVVSIYSFDIGTNSLTNLLVKPRTFENWNLSLCKDITFHILTDSFLELSFWIATFKFSENWYSITLSLIKLLVKLFECFSKLKLRSKDVSCSFNFLVFLSAILTEITPLNINKVPKNILIF
ncbi:hypothetical protein ASO20_02390 [Mycoplasma sp. (ex Biomphalaria glabrata)]|nr:hypothetical protein ASO20_02390 [Mycoplasma sp. (ex Biomphalaria glabrata)]